jgi:hypothetical protein
MDGHKIETRTHDLEQGSSQTLGIAGRQYEKPNVPPSPYYDKTIKPVLQHRPRLENLDQFMDSTTPGFGVDLGYRMNHFDIKVIHISKSGTVDSIIDCDTPEKFHQAIGEDQERSGTLVIPKDISRAMIETLGTQYNLEPEFFATHLLGTESFHMGRWECNLLPAHQTFSQTASGRLLSTRESFDGRIISEVDKQSANLGNVERAPQEAYIS